MQEACLQSHHMRHAAEHENQHGDEACAVFALNAVHQEGEVAGVREHPERSRQLLLAVPQQQGIQLGIAELPRVSHGVHHHTLQVGAGVDIRHLQGEA